MVSAIPKERNHPPNYKDLPVRLKRKSRLESIKKRGMISTIPKEKNNHNHPPNYKDLPVRLKRKSRLESIKKRGMISTIPKERNQPQPPAQL
jgi:hypothetical protein